MAGQYGTSWDKSNNHFGKSPILAGPSGPALPEFPRVIIVGKNPSKNLIGAAFLVVCAIRTCGKLFPWVAYQPTR